MTQLTPDHDSPDSAYRPIDGLVVRGGDDPETTARGLWGPELANLLLMAREAAEDASDPELQKSGAWVVGAFEDALEIDP